MKPFQTLFCFKIFDNLSFSLRKSQNLVSDQEQVTP